MSIKVFHNVSSVGKSSYGLGQISVSLAMAQLEMGLNSVIHSFSNRDELIWSSLIHNYPLDRYKTFTLNKKDIFNALSLLQFRVNKDKSDALFIHQHGIWSKNSFISLLGRRNLGLKTIVAPHGSLSPLALEKSKYKKKLALTTYEGYNLKYASALHATSAYEIEDFRKIGLKNPIAYIENGISKKELSSTGNKYKFLEKYNLPQDKKILLYLSRITPKKGLDMLLKAIYKMDIKFDDWILVIVGNDEFNYQSIIEILISELRLTNKVFIVEPQFGNDKYDVFDASHFFILPSYSEGSPMVILDALASGTPVITTKSSSWQDLNNFSCGFWVDIDQTEIEKCLNVMINLTNDELESMGVNAKKMIQSKYLWENSAKKTIELYEWLPTKSEIYKPDFIYL